MAVRCPNIQSKEWKRMLLSLGSTNAWNLFIANGESVPSMDTIDDVIRNFKNETNDIQSSVVKGLSPMEEHYAMRSIGKMIFDSILEKPNMTIDQRFESVRETLTAWEQYHRDVAEKVLEGEEQDAYLNFANSTEKLLDPEAFDQLKSKITNDVRKQLSALDFADESIDEDQKVTKGENYGKENFLIDNKRKVSRRLKGFISYIEDVIFDENNELQPRLNSFNLPMYIPFSSVYSSLSYHLANTSFDGMAAKLEAIGKYNPVIKQIADKLESLKEETGLDQVSIYKEFMTNFKKQHLKFTTTKLDQQNFKSRVFYSNRNNAESIVLSQWQEKVKVFASSKDSVLKHDANSNIFPNKERITSIVENFRSEETKITNDNSLTAREKESKTVRLTIDTLAKLGITFENNIYDVITTNPKLINFEEFTPKAFIASSKYVFKRFDNLISNKLFVEQNPFIEGEESKNFRLLAAVALSTSNAFFSTSFLNEESKNIYAISNNSFMSTTYDKLMDGNEYIEKLQKLSVYHEDSYLLEQLKNPTFKKNFEIVFKSVFNTEHSSKQGKPFQELVESERWLVKIIDFHNSGKEKGYFQTPTYGDRKVVTFVGMPKLEGRIHNGEVQGKVLDVMYRIFLSEKKSIDQATKHLEEFKNDPKKLLLNYHTGEKTGLKFHLLPFMNDFKINGIPIAEIENYEGYKTEIKKAISDYMIERVRDDIKTLERLGLYEKRNTFKEKVSKEVFFENFLLNYQAAYAGMYQIFSNNIAQSEGFTKGSKRNALILSSGTNIFHTKEDLGIKSLTVGDVKFLLRRREAIKKALTKEFEERGKNVGITIPESRVDEILSNFDDTNITDSQAYMSIKFYREFMDRFGKLTPELADILDKAESGKKISIAKFIEANSLNPVKPVYVADVYDEDLKMMVRRVYKFSAFPLFKQLTETIEEYNDLDQFRQEVENSEVDMVFYESASKVGTNNIHQFYDEEYLVNPIKKEDVQTIPWEGMFLQQENPYDEDKDSITGGSQIWKLITGDLLDPQVGDIKFDVGDKKIGAREIHQFLNDLYSTNIQEDYKALLEEFGIKEYEGTENKRYEIVSLKALKDVLLKEAVERGYSLTSLVALEIEVNNVTKEENFIIPLSFTPNSIQFESMLNSLISNRMKQHLRGRSYVQGSPNGFSTTLDQLSEGVRSKIEWAEGKSGIEYYRIGRDGKTLPMQILIPNAYKKYVKGGRLSPEFARIIGFRIPTQAFNSMMFAEVVGYLPDEAGNLMIVPHEFLKQTGGDMDFDKVYTYNRHGYNNTVPKQPQEELEREYQNFISTENWSSKAKKEIIRKNIENFDDVRGRQEWANIHEMYYSKEEGKFFMQKGAGDYVPVKYNYEQAPQENTREQRENALLDLHMSIMEHPMMLSRLIDVDTQKPITDENDAIDKTLSATKKDKHPLSITEQDKLYDSNNAGKSGRATATLHSSYHAISQYIPLQVRIYIKTKAGLMPNVAGVKFLNEKGNIIQAKKEQGNSWAGSYMLNKVRGHGGHLISDVIRWIQSATLDNATKGELGRTKLDDNTLNTAMYIARTGFGIDYIARFFRQPAIQAYSRNLNNKKAFFARYNDKMEDEVTTELLLDNVNKLRDTRVIKDESVFEKMSQIDFTDFDGVSLEEMNKFLILKEKIADNTATEEEKAIYYQGQIKIVKAFYVYKQTADNLMASMTPTNTDVKGVGKNYHAVLERVRGLDSLKDLPLIENAELLLENTFLGKVAELGVRTAKDIFTDTNILYYNTDLFKTVYDLAKDAEIFSKTGRISESRFNDLRRDFTTFLSTHNENGIFNDLFDDYATDNLRHLRQSLLFGKNSLAARLSKYRKKIKDGETIEGEWLINNLLLDITGWENTPDSIQYNSSNIEQEEAPLAENSLIEMNNSENPETRQLARDLIAYIYMTGGTVASVRGLSSIIPSSYLRRKGFGTFYNENLVILSKVSIFADRFFDQFMRNNPKYIKTIDINDITIAKGSRYYANISTPTDKVASLYIKVYTQPMPNSNEKSIEMLFKRDYSKDGTTHYFRIDSLGYGYQSEYDINDDTVRSAYPINNIPNYSAVANLDNITEKDDYEDRLQMEAGSVNEFMGEEKPITTNREFEIADNLTPIEQNFTDGQGGRKMQPQFKGKSTMDLIISGDRTRTTRANTDIQRMAKDYGLSKISDLEGKVIRMTDKKGRQVYTRITKVVPFTQEYQNRTWQKEGWNKEVTDKLIGKYPYAIEFEVVNKTTEKGIEVKPGEQLDLFSPESKVEVKEDESAAGQWKTHGEKLTAKYGVGIKDAWSRFTPEERKFKIKCLIG